jgi:hypothetical protein
MNFQQSKSPLGIKQSLALWTRILYSKTAGKTTNKITTRAGFKGDSSVLSNYSHKITTQ